MNGKLKDAFDIKLLIQIITIVITITIAWSTMGNKVDTHIVKKDVHMDYRELKGEFVTKERFDNEIRYMNETLDRIESLLLGSD